MQTPAARREFRPRHLHRQARRALPGASKERLERLCRRLALPEEAGHRCAARASGTAAPARDQDDARNIGTRRQALGHLEAVHAGQLHVEQDDVRPEPLDRVEPVSPSSTAPTTLAPCSSSSAVADDRKPSWSSTINTDGRMGESSHRSSPLSHCQRNRNPQEAAPSLPTGTRCYPQCRALVRRMAASAGRWYGRRVMRRRSYARQDDHWIDGYRGRGDHGRARGRSSGAAAEGGAAPSRVDAVTLANCSPTATAASPPSRRWGRFVERVKTISRMASSSST